MKKWYLIVGMMAVLFLPNSIYSQNNAINFDGANDYVNLNSIQGEMQANNAHFTIEFWIRANPNQLNDFSCLFAINPTNENFFNRLTLRLSGPGETVANSVAINIADGGTNNILCGTINVLDSACHHIAYTYNNGINELFIDGISQGTLTLAYILLGTDRYSLGQEFDAPGTTLSQLYGGSMDDLRIWDHIRTESEIQVNRNQELVGNETGLIAYYNFNQGIAGGNNTSIATLTDNTVNGNDGNLMNFARNGATSNFIENECCSFNQSYIIKNTNVTTNTNWTNKILIPDNTTITVDNAILDVTNVDIIFGQCSGIDFINGATLRANNSVFRPCNMNDTWRGLHFDGESNSLHQINENTFKNAEIALLFTKNANAEINSNTLSNCNEGVKMDHSLFTESIFGNNFVTNNAYPQFTNCYTTTSPNDVIHIHGIGSSNQAAISNLSVNQNNFTMANTSGTIVATAIDLLNSQATISENTLTNIEFGISITDPRYAVLIEGNEIEYNYQFQQASSLPAISQINIFNSKGIFVSINNNELRNSRNDIYSSSAIYLEHCNNLIVQNNKIEGFNVGINAENTTKVNFTENQISSISGTGIYLNEGDQISTNYITCNDVTMIMGYGTSIYTLQSSRQTNITSNCLKDGSTGILVSGSGPIPFIRNNFLYNYRTGIRNIGHSGTIGTTTDPGMNTLWSNSSTAFDVSSTTPITIANNFGQTNCTWATVSVQGNTAIHSTASCGHQITSANAVSQGSLNTKYTCDNLTQFVVPMKQIGNYALLPTISEAIDFLNVDENKVGTISRMISLDGFDEFYLNQLLNSLEIESEDENLILYDFYKSNNRFLEANGILEVLTANKFNDFVAIEKMILKKLNGENLTTSNFNELSAIVSNQNTENTVYNLAVSLTKTGSSHGTYRITLPLENDGDYGTGNSGNNIIDHQTILTVYPNPSANEINIQILEGKQVDGQLIQIYDLYGNVVQSTSLDFISGRTVVNISNLASGSYFIMLETDGIKSERTKFIKL